MLMHPIAPAGTRMVFEYLQLASSETDFFSWGHVSESGIATGYECFVAETDRTAGSHVIKELPPRTDFFGRHASQFS